MNTQTNQQLLEAYSADRSETAFSEIVRRHVDLVYSAALRMVGDAHSAEDVTQSVFVVLAQNAAKLSSHPVLSGWLHRTAQNLAANAVRSNVRRQAREQEAATMTDLLSHEPEAGWDQIAPLLDAAVGELSEPDRDALLLRYFERKSAREMAQVLGVSEDAAQKRVSRAVDRLREVLARNGVSVGASGLGLCLTANAVQAAPAGLATTVSAAAALVGTAAASTGTVAATTQTIAMTTLQKILVTTTVAVLAGVGIYEARQAGNLRRQNDSLQQQHAELTAQMLALQQERDLAAQRLTVVAAELATLKKQPTEVHQLRGQVGVLRQEKEAMASKSALSKITADPEMRRMIREQQKAGMNSVYGEFAKRLKLTPETSAQFGDLLADHVMDNIELITQVLHDKTGTDEINRIFTAQEAALRDQLLGLLGADGLEQFSEYSKRLLASVTASQFEPEMAGDAKIKADKQKLFQQILQEEVQGALARAGLSADYQTIPMLNFRNIASESQGEFSVQLLDSIYAAAAGRAGDFLSESELKAFEKFRAKALDNNRSALAINRKMMAPIASDAGK